MARCSAVAIALLVLAGPFMQAGRAQAPAPAPSTGGGACSNKLSRKGFSAGPPVTLKPVLPLHIHMGV